MCNLAGILPFISSSPKIFPVLSLLIYKSIKVRVFLKKEIVKFEYYLRSKKCYNNKFLGCNLSAAWWLLEIFKRISFILIIFWLIFGEYFSNLFVKNNEFHVLFYDNKVLTIKFPSMII